MSLADLPVLDMLRTQMKWHHSRQRVLAENVANADTPGFQAQDLERVDFSKMLASASSSQSVGTARTNPMHIGNASSSSAGSQFKASGNGDFETTPSGNAVVLEEQMIQITANQMDYQAATTLYSKSINLLRMALGQGSR